MSGSEPGEQQPDLAPDAAGVLARLPRTRPQHSSARRAQARKGAGRSADASTSMNGASANGTQGTKAAGGASARGATGSRAATSAKKPTRARRASRTTHAAREPAPMQGFECEGERAGRTVNPPGGAELVASVGEVVGELAKAGLSTGERLLKEAFSRFPF